MAIFIEYMHEKQVFIYFLLDKEGRTSSEAEKLLKAKRRFDFQGLTNVIPDRDRIIIWGSSFEEENFTDYEIQPSLSARVDLPTVFFLNDVQFFVDDF
ncbi:hypothetical protein HZA55_00205 [Candidatus Poribacteria bacterium]|nr:hypothetical protein [Candidatus Poribacteria bacterium]